MFIFNEIKVQLSKTVWYTIILQKRYHYFLIKIHTQYLSGQCLLIVNGVLSIISIIFIYVKIRYIKLVYGILKRSKKKKIDWL